ncbi:hypothetical protein [Longimicrobium terrae]|uniref:Uncharacterized protein n=1 Tax=Longimicrobium terrae TaxID=1639882 RepID=A0A841H5J7_9BACT|nr:hypothetical protein [Longimicrobium terrae]MBB4639265.1 hypothetical protein [Longimicrobium terrae]MBB6073505.1 hypothetical protein [Longimicrobium terrae]NNC32245.1 hypothetical protein [Longimicrobium terrae]
MIGEHPEGGLNDLRLEEVELSDGEQTWHITLGWLESAVHERASAAAPHREVHASPRVYRTIDVDAGSGVVKAMHIRSLAA